MLGKQALTWGSYNVTVEELFDLFGKFGPIRYVPTQDALQLRAAYETDLEYRQVRQGIANNTKGTAFVVYEDVMDAKQACDKLNGFNFQNRYLVGKQLFLPSPSLSRR
jgi:pre-mRNA branch site protein p14